MPNSVPGLNVRVGSTGIGRPSCAHPTNSWASQLNEVIVSDKDLSRDAPNASGFDAIVTEVRTAREAIFARAGYDLQELGRQLQARQTAVGREGVTLPPLVAGQRQFTPRSLERNADGDAPSNNRLQLTAELWCARCARVI